LQRLKFDFAKVAEACGARGPTIERPEDAEHILREAVEHQGPTAVQAVVAPSEPPMPGKIGTEQAIQFVQALARISHRAWVATGFH
jgi:pyruvate dehydrogenase (quinone)